MKKFTVILLGALVAASALQAEKPAGKSGPKEPGGMPGHMLKMMDANNDGKVSKEEWQAHHEQRFTEIDADKDGSITPTEMKEHHTKMREKRAEMCPDCPRGKKGKRKSPRKKAAEDEDE